MQDIKTLTDGYGYVPFIKTIEHRTHSEDELKDYLLTVLLYDMNIPARAQLVENDYFLTLIARRGPTVADEIKKVLQSTVALEMALKKATTTESNDAFYMGMIV